MRSPVDTLFSAVLPPIADPSSVFGSPSPRLIAPVLAALAVAGTGCRRDAAAPPAAPSPYETRRPTDGGTGVVYMGREIAIPVAEHAAEWLDRPERATTELPDRVLDALALDSTATVCDVGAGTGYFSFRLADRLPAGHVVAQDVSGPMLDLVARRRDSLGLTARLDTVRGTDRSPRLAPGTCDLVLVVDSYHEFRYPREMMQGLVASLRPGGRVALVEYRGEDATIGIRPLHAMTRAQVEREMGAAGLALVAAPDVLPTQHLLVFSVAAPL